MAIPRTVTAHLKQAKVAAEEVAHRTVYTAYDLASTLGEKLENVAKTLLVKADNDHVLVVLPANRRLDLTKLKKELGVKKISIASEKDMVAKFKVKAGALTPFGTIHKVKVFADKTLTKTSHAFFSAGSFTESLKMKVKDFLTLENAQTGDVSTAADLPKLPVQKPAKPIKRTTAKTKKR